MSAVRCLGLGSLDAQIWHCPSAVAAHLPELAACVYKRQLGEVTTDCNRQVSPGEVLRSRHLQHL